MLSSLPSSLLLSSLLLAVAALPVESAATELRQLTARDFSSSTKHGVWFVEYFSPHCGHCRNFAPTWRQLVEHVESQENPGIALAQVNCVTEGDLCNDHDVKGYPSLRLYQDGESLEDFDERDFDSLKEYVTKHARKVSAPPPNPKGVVLPLNATTFRLAISDGPTFVKFFAPWCGHCKKLAPTWVQFAARMKDRVTVAEVNCEDHKSICAKENIKGYPSIFFYQHGHTVDYTGGRTLDALEAFTDAALAPPITSISSSDLTLLVDQREVLYLLVHDQLDLTLQDSIEEASQALHGSPQIFSIRSSPKLLASLSLSANQQLPALVSLKDHSIVAHRHLVISTTTPAQHISDWLIAHSLPTSTELSAENFQRVMGPSPAPRGSPSRLVVLAAVDTQNLAQIDSVKQAAKTWHGGELASDTRLVVFAWMDKERWHSWLKSVYGVKKGPEPSVVIVDHGHLLYYDTFATGAPIQLDSPNIVAALEGVYSGVLQPKHSENIAERFARWLNGWVQAFLSGISEHPVRSVLIGAVALTGIFIGIKRILEEDTRNSIYINNKSGTRLD